MIAQHVRLPFAVAALCFLCAGLTRCSKTPSVPQQAGVAAYGAALETCITTAKATDGGIASYRACRDHVDQQFGRSPEDGGK